MGSIYENDVGYTTTVDGVQVLPSSTVADLFCLIYYQHFVSDPESDTTVFFVF